jgi:hypothetical protein
VRWRLDDELIVKTGCIRAIELDCAHERACSSAWNVIDVSRRATSDIATFLLKRWLTKTTTTTSTAEGTTTTITRTTWSVTAGNEKTLRGIPAIGRGVQGHIEGTRPDQRAQS